jgi:hypothetical protein
MRPTSGGYSRRLATRTTFRVGVGVVQHYYVRPGAEGLGRAGIVYPCMIGVDGLVDGLQIRYRKASLVTQFNLFLFITVGLLTFITDLEGRKKGK